MNAAPGTSAERSTQQSGAETFDACCLRRVCCSRIRAVQNVCVCVVVVCFVVWFVCECECELANKPAACEDFGGGSKMLLRS